MDRGVSWIIFAVRRMVIVPCRNFGQLRSYIKRSDRVYTYSYVSTSFMTLRTLHCALCNGKCQFRALLLFVVRYMSLYAAELS